jgi:hypothetical protein
MVLFFMQRPTLVSHTGRSCGQQCLRMKQQQHHQPVLQVKAVHTVRCADSGCEMHMHQNTANK